MFKLLATSIVFLISVSLSSCAFNKYQDDKPYFGISDGLKDGSGMTGYRTKGNGVIDNMIEKTFGGRNSRGSNSHESGNAR